MRMALLCKGSVNHIIYLLQGKCKFESNSPAACDDLSLTADVTFENQYENGNMHKVTLHFPGYLIKYAGTRIYHKSKEVCEFHGSDN